MALLSIYHIIQTTRNLFMIAPHKHIADQQVFWHEWLLWKFITNSARFVIHLLSFSYTNVLTFQRMCRIKPKRVRRPTTHTRHWKLDHHRISKWKRSQAIPNKQVSICENLFVSIWKKEGRRNLILQKSLSVYKALHTANGLVQWVFNYVF